MAEPLSGNVIVRWHSLLQPSRTVFRYGAHQDARRTSQIFVTRSELWRVQAQVCRKRACRCTGWAMADESSAVGPVVAYPLGEL